MKLFEVLARKKGFAKIAFFATLSFLIFSFIAAPQPAHAAPNGFFSGIVHSLVGSVISVNDVSANLISWAAYYINLLLATLAGIAIAVIIYVITIILAVSANVVNTLAVQAGFSVTLALANLGFVVAMIIMGLATILRIESYGMKKMLWKLIVAAILVNFSLVIGGVVINFANTLTLSFLQQFPGSGSSSTAWMNGFPSALAGAFAPQRAWLSGFGNNVANNVNSTQQGTLLGQSMASSIIPIFSILFTLVMLVVILLVLVGLLITLLVRYVYLTILLIVMPLAWLLWIFPSTKGQFTRWWSEFIRWNFYAPGVVFFLYLSVAIAGQMSAGNNDPNNPAAGLTGIAGTSLASANGSFANQITGFLGALGGSLIGTFLQMVVVIGLAVGGMMMANKMGITGANIAIDAANGVKDRTTNYVTKQSKKAARAGFRNVGGEKVLEKMRTGQVGAGKLKGVPGLDWAVRRGSSIVGRAVQPHTTNADIVEQAKKAVPKDKDQILDNLKGSMNQEDTFAHIAAAVEKGWLTPDAMINGKKAQDYLDENKNIKGYGQGKLSADADKLFLSDINYRNAERALASGQNTTVITKDVKDAFGNVVLKAGETASALDVMNTSMQNMLQNFSKDDALKASSSYIFGPKTNKQSREIRIRNIAAQAPQLMPSFIRKMNSPALVTFEEQYPEAIAKERLVVHDKAQAVLANTKLTDSQRDAEIARLKTVDDRFVKVSKDFKHALGHNAVSEGHEHGEEHEEHENHDDGHGSGGKKGGGSTPKPSTPPPAAPSGGGGGDHGSGGGH